MNQSDYSSYYNNKLKTSLSSKKTEEWQNRVNNYRDTITHNNTTKKDCGCEGKK